MIFYDKGRSFFEAEFSRELLLSEITTTFNKFRLFNFLAKVNFFFFNHRPNFLRSTSKDQNQSTFWWSIYHTHFLISVTSQPLIFCGYILRWTTELFHFPIKLKTKALRSKPQDQYFFSESFLSKAVITPR